MRLQIEDSDVDDFVDCWQRTIQMSSIVDPYNEKRNALVFSFDNELNAFLNYTKGYHKHVDRRPYFERMPRLMIEIAKIMFPYRETGGRVFLDDRAAFFVDSSSTKTYLCELSWPKTRDVIGEVRKYWSGLKPRNVITIILTQRGGVGASSR